MKNQSTLQQRVLAATSISYIVVILDTSIVNVALERISHALQTNIAGLQWVVNAYTLTFAGLLMLGGRSADLLGRRRVFLSGTAMFALSSLICALASSRGLLIGARGVQGVAGADRRGVLGVEVLVLGHLVRLFVRRAL